MKCVPQSFSGGNSRNQTRGHRFSSWLREKGIAIFLTSEWKNLLVLVLQHLTAVPVALSLRLIGGFFSLWKLILVFKVITEDLVMSVSLQVSFCVVWFYSQACHSSTRADFNSYLICSGIMRKSINIMRSRWQYLVFWFEYRLHCIRASLIVYFFVKLASTHLSVRLMACIWVCLRLSWWTHL